MAVIVGADFAGYRLERELGSGGMGTVFLAQHPRLPRRDALKILAEAHTGDSAFRARFLREAEVAAGLHHPNVVAVRDRGEHDGRMWIAMQYVDGVDLAEILRRGPTERLSIERVLRIVTEAAKGLDAIHGAGLLHRDVKPANILVEERPGLGDRVLVTDFGIARPADETATLTAGFTATLDYVAPERLSGGVGDRRADVYALGCVLYQMLTGAVPFPRDTPSGVIFAHLSDPPPRPSIFGVAPGFDEVIATALAKNPEERFSSCGALAAAARAAADTTVRIGAATAGRRRITRRRAVVGAALVAVLAAAVTTAAVFGHDSSSRPSSKAMALGPQTSVDPVSWGAYTYIAQAFPGLLPASQFGVGYQELYACEAIDEDRKIRSVDVYVPVGRIGCEGNRDPAVTVDLVCNADRSPIAPPRTFDTAEGDEHWTRPSGSGYLHWGTDLGFEYKITGYLRVYFDNPNRSFCYIVVTGASTGAELRTRWWTEAPL
ncbi:serine/threonine-protein kinase [Nocardia sp. CDC160]|uniref:serine/threonine-protein kinase n=1 Tax=Nocardia sp. CDC160 TaxID=3112166 RepID=UPI002DB68AA1|nr:serine/threonine-protein kinase [Nocardia sp. CDC160]MEC3917821.1 serine/threonine-protein kinase [Nocardia sp. CDC160]